MTNDNEQPEVDQPKIKRFDVLNDFVENRLRYLRPNEVLVWLCYYRHDGTHQADRKIYPKTAAISQMCGSRENHIRAARRRLIQVGLLIEVEASQGTKPGKYRTAYPSEIRDSKKWALIQNADALPPKIRTATNPKSGRQSDSCLYITEQTIEQTIEQTTAPQGKWTDAEVESIYVEYPRKKDKPAAFKAIRKALTKLAKRKTTDPVAWLRERAKAFAKTVGADLTFIKYPATWFNNECYDETFTKGPTPHAPSKKQREQFAEPTPAEYANAIG